MMKRNLRDILNMTLKLRFPNPPMMFPQRN
jgi:hypothetical protein